jgi:hypothetical protein
MALAARHYKGGCLGKLLSPSRLGPKSKSRGAQDRPKIGQNKKASATIDMFFVFFLLLLRAQQANFLDLGSMVS